MSLIIIDKHLDELKNSAKDKTDWIGGAPRAWYRWVRNHTGIDLYRLVEKYAAAGMSPTELPEMADRGVLKDMISDPKSDIVSICISILAWGQMNRKNAAYLSACESDWITLADEIRDGKHSRIEAYDRFAYLRSNQKLKGMGPAYFTKLIYFLSPNSDSRGYIMDQWTSASVNLLSGKKIVHLNRSNHALTKGARIFETVNDKNTSKNYEEYCRYVEGLSKRLSVDGEQFTPECVEEMLFSEGRGKGSWRRYLVSKRREETSAKNLYT